MKLSKKDILTRGIIKENPVLILVLGLCPALAVSTQAENAIGMGLATTFVLLRDSVFSPCERRQGCRSDGSYKQDV